MKSSVQQDAPSYCARPRSVGVLQQSQHHYCGRRVGFGERVQNGDEDATRLVFSSRTVRLTVEPRVIVIARGGLFDRLRGRAVSTIERACIVDVRVLPWGSALLLVTADGEARTFELGAEAQAACDAILRGPRCAVACACERCATLSPREG